MARASALVGWLRFAWSTLTSMRTALILLLVLGIAAVPGSLLPQRPTDPVGVAAYVRANPVTGPWLDRLGFFDVFASPWFAAIYLLLFTSLVGCIVPRTAGFFRELRSAPPAPPGRLDRLPGHLTAAVGTAPEQVLDAAAAHLRSRGYRLRREAGALSGERGYVREAGNLVFHVCLLTTLVGLAWGSLFSFRGTAIVVEGQAFSNTLTQYDEFGAGAGFRGDQLTPFAFRVDRFDVEFETGPVETGAARGFSAAVVVSEPGRPDVPATLQVNAPVQVGADSVHLLGHGYAPVLTVKDGNGDVAFSGPVVFLPQDANFRSDGVVKVPDARPSRLAFEGVFLPTAATDGPSGMVSVFPDTLSPRLLLNVWSGAPKVETGQPENVYSLDRTGLEQLMEGEEPVRVALEPGTGYKLPDGLGSVSFDGWKRWTKLQVSNTPGAWLVLGSVVLAILGMAVSLTVTPRRLYVRVGPPAPGGPGEPAPASTVSVAGLDRAEGRPGLTDEVTALAQACGVRATLARVEEEEQP